MSARMRTLALGLVLVLLPPSGTGAFAAGAGSSETSGGADTELRSARALIEDERFEEALAQLETVVAGDEDNADAWNLIGFSLRKLERYEQALQGYARALAIDPRHAEAIEYLGELYLALGDLAGAQEQLARLDEICASGCEELDELKEAVARFKAARGG